MLFLKPEVRVDLARMIDVLVMIKVNLGFLK